MSEMNHSEPFSYLGLTKIDNLTEKEINEICQAVQKLPWQLMKCVAFDVAIYQYRYRALRMKDGEGWSRYFETDEESYNRYKEQPFQHDWQFEVRVLYEKKDCPPPLIIKDCTFVNKTNVGIRII